MKEDIPIFFKKNPKTKKTEAEILAQRAADALSDLVDTYLTQAQKDFLVMQDLLSRSYRASPQDRFRLIRDDFFMKMHDLKGQGATFGYPLLTEIGSYTCDFLRNKKEVTVSDLNLLKDVLSDMDLVLKNNLTGSGGSLGKEIHHHLQKGKNG